MIFHRFPAVKIIADHDFRVRHCLLGLPNINIQDVTRVISHRQALDQCDDWLRTELPQAERDAVYDTAGAAKMIADGQMRNTAAICSELAASHYGTFFYWDAKVVH